MEPQETQNTSAAPEQIKTTIPPEVPTAPQEDNNQMLMGILSYLGPLVIVSYLMAKDDPVVKFHIKQGIVLCGISLVLYVARMSILPWALFPIIGLVNLGLLILSIVGIVNVINHKQEPLPLVGMLATNIKI